MHLSESPSSESSRQGGRADPSGFFFFPARVDGEMGLGEAARTLYRYRFLILIPFLIGAVALPLLFRIGPETFTAETRLKPVASERQPEFASTLSSLSSIVGAGAIQPSMSGRVSLALGTLDSRKFLMGFVDDLDLVDELFPGAPLDEVTPLAAYEALKERIEVRLVPERDLVVVELAWQDPQRSADLLNTLIRRLNLLIRENEVAERQARIDYLQQLSESTNVLGVKEAIYRLIESEMKEVAFARVTDEYALRVIDPAYPPEEPSGPGTLFVVVAGGGIGMMMGLGLMGVVLGIRWLRGTLRESPETAKG